MFTGIVQDIGTIVSSEPAEHGRRLTVRCRDTAGSLRPGDSVSINGVCQTVEAIEDDRFAFTAVGETLKKTTLGSLKAGRRVNVESALTPRTPMGGHWVQGHVDGVGEIVSFGKKGEDRMLEVRLPAVAYKLAVPKGSIAIDGVSLTIVGVSEGGSVTITVIPRTFEHTIAGEYAEGTKVNVEADILGKYVMEFLERIHSASQNDKDEVKR